MEPNERLIRFREIEAMTGLRSRTTVQRMVDRDEFPKPIKISARAIAWPLSAVQAWVAEKASQSAGGERE